MDAIGNNVVQRNPWLTEGSLDSLRNVLAMAESTGILQKMNVLEAEDHHKELYQTTPSLKMIRIQKEIRDMRLRLHQVNLEIQCHLQDKETKDITHVDILEQRIGHIKEANSHLEAIIRQKDALIGRLQKPFVNDFLRVEASYQRHKASTKGTPKPGHYPEDQYAKIGRIHYACEALPQLVPTVSDLPTQLENIDWAVKLDIADLETMLSDVSGTLAGQQTLYQSMLKQRQAMHSLTSKLCHPMDV